MKNIFKVGQLVTRIAHNKSVGVKMNLETFLVTSVTVNNTTGEMDGYECTSFTHNDCDSCGKTPKHQQLINHWTVAQVQELIEKSCTLSLLMESGEEALETGFEQPEPFFPMVEKLNAYNDLLRTHLKYLKELENPTPIKFGDFVVVSNQTVAGIVGIIESVIPTEQHGNLYKVTLMNTTPKSDTYYLPAADLQVVTLSK